MKILFLDDDINRRRLFRESCKDHDLSEVETSDDAIKFLEKYSPYDLVSLDHDLGGQVYVASDEKSGYHVALYISQMSKDKLPKKVIIHSYNFVGAKKMFDVLRDIVDVVYEPFNMRKDNELNRLFKQIGG